MKNSNGTVTFSLKSIATIVGLLLTFMTVVHLSFSFIPFPYNPSEKARVQSEIENLKKRQEEMKEEINELEDRLNRLQESLIKNKR